MSYGEILRKASHYDNNFRKICAQHYCEVVPAMGSCMDVRLGATATGSFFWMSYEMILRNASRYVNTFLRCYVTNANVGNYKGWVALVECLG